MGLWPTHGNENGGTVIPSKAEGSAFFLICTCAQQASFAGVWSLGSESASGGRMKVAQHGSAGCA